MALARAGGRASHARARRGLTKPRLHRRASLPSAHERESDVDDARGDMVKAKLRKKAERAERASKSTTTAAGDARKDAAAEDDVEDAMASLTSHHRRKVKKRAVFLESAS